MKRGANKPPTRSEPATAASPLLSSILTGELSIVLLYSLNRDDQRLLIGEHFSPNEILNAPLAPNERVSRSRWINLVKSAILHSSSQFFMLEMVPPITPSMLQVAAHTCLSSDRGLVISAATTNLFCELRDVMDEHKVSMRGIYLRHCDTFKHLVGEIF